MGRESSIQRALLAALGRRPHAYFRKRPQDAIAGDGDPDVSGCYRARYVAFEIKHPKTGRLSRIQKLTIAQILDAGGFAWGVTSVAEALAHLETIAWEKP